MSKQQTVSTIHWWKNKKIIMRIVVLVVLVVILFIVFIVLAYFYHWGWTGLPNSPRTTTTTEVTQPSNIQKVTTTVEDQPAKTLWDWLPLLIQLVGALAIPVVVAVGTAVFTTRQTRISEDNRKQQHDTDLQIAEIQQQEELLRTYFDKISELLLHKELSTNPNIQSIVRARTLAVLQRFNTERKAIVLRFLYDSALLQYVKHFLYSLDLSHIDLSRIDLSGANLSGTNLSEANLSEAHLSEANLHKAQLNGATLIRADLSAAYLNGAILHGAILHGAILNEAILNKVNLSSANLSKADLSGAILIGADLNEAILDEAIVTARQLEEAKNVTPKQLAQIKPSKSAATREAKVLPTSTTLAQSEARPNQMSSKEREQPAQGTDATS